MTAAFDPRIVQVGIGIGDEIVYYEGLYITATGCRYGSETINECQVRIENLTRDHRNKILQETSPFTDANNKTPKTLIVKAGRESYGASTIFVGNLTTSGVTQPPDIGIILNAMTSFDASLRIFAVSMPAQASLKTIAQTAANNIGVTLNFQATDKTISNYSFTGAAQQHVKKIAECGNVVAYIDNTSLIVLDKGQPLKAVVKKLSLHTGMIGIPQIIEYGVRVKMLVDNEVTLGGRIDLVSELNPSLNGAYTVVKLDFDIASRDTPFYYIADCRKMP